MSSLAAFAAFAAHCRDMATAEHRPECCRCGQLWCCGCMGHPAGKPWGRAASRWAEHAEECPGNPAAPPCTGCVTDADRALWTRLADEVDAYLEPHPTLWGDENGPEAALGAPSTPSPGPGATDVISGPQIGAERFEGER